MFDGLSELFNTPEVVDSKESTPRKDDLTTAKKDSNLNIMSFAVPDKNLMMATDPLKQNNNFKYKSCSVVLNNIGHLKTLNAKELRKSLDQLEAAAALIKPELIEESDTEIFEFEESDGPLPPLYLLRDEGNEKWILLADLLSHLKVKSKEAVLKQVRNRYFTVFYCNAGS